MTRAAAAAVAAATGAEELRDALSHPYHGAGKRAQQADASKVSYEGCMLGWYPLRAAG